MAFPTETVYGLGADATNFSAVQKVFNVKGRPADNPLIVHVASRSMVEQFAAEIPEESEKLMNAFWPGPLTLIFKKKPNVLDIITAGLDTVALRWPAHPLSQDLIARAGPLVAPSANSSGKPSPTRPEHVKEDFGDHFPIVEAGETQIGLESTVLDISQSPFHIYRPGAISRNQIENIIEKPVAAAPETSDKTTKTKSPGTKYSHYSPTAAVKWLTNKSFEQENTLYLTHTIEPYEPSEHIIYFEKDYQEMAHQLYDRFRQADHEGYSQILVEPFSEQTLRDEPLAEALQNRISKAVG